ncbi:hypothetical protein Goklo_016172 [Gossypium klotzschianum]|uniref:Zinc knuckle CX2CX4HX4C domain-containing protein n=1 Tax=Gossypium klotzschianum TaxID=34286 RepID=A0A7J8UDD6_9ROSI|nr:hypothetical protein [Gossypium klotzschianum]
MTSWRLMTEEIIDLLERLKFSEEESTQVISKNDVHSVRSFESWAVGKIMATEAPNREAMYRVFKSLWYTKEEVDFVVLKEGVVIDKFGYQEDYSRILNLTPWLFDRCLFSMLPFEEGKDIDSYEFWWLPFWLRIYNIPLELLDRQTALDVGDALGELVVIDWKDHNGGEGTEETGVIKYERLPDFYYDCGLIGHSSKTCKYNKGSTLNESNLQYGSWMRASLVNPTQDRGMRRNGVELVKPKAQMNADKEESQTNSRGESGQLG